MYIASFFHPSQRKRLKEITGDVSQTKPLLTKREILKLDANGKNTNHENLTCGLQCYQRVRDPHG